MNGERAKREYVRVDLLKASRHVEFFDVGVVSRNVKRFNDYYFQVDIHFLCKSSLDVWIRGVFVFGEQLNILHRVSEPSNLVTADNKLEGGC